MSLECSECERDIRSGHDRTCSRFCGPEPECTCTFWLTGMDDEHHQDACAVTLWRNQSTEERDA